MSWLRIFAIPAGVGALTAFGLGAALVWEGAGDGIAAGCLTAPVAATVFALWKRRR